MKSITYRNLGERIRGINDEFGKQELRTNDLCRQIFEKYGYNPVTPRNFDTEPPIGRIMGYTTDFGIDDVVYIREIPDDDPLNLKQFKSCKWDDTVYTIDYKSNNGFYSDSIYVKLMVKRPYKEYLPYCNKKGKLVDPIDYHQERDRKKWKIALKEGKDTIKGEMKRYYGNRGIEI